MDIQYIQLQEVNKGLSSNEVSYGEKNLIPNLQKNVIHSIVFQNILYFDFIFLKYSNCICFVLLQVQIYRFILRTCLFFNLNWKINFSLKGAPNLCHVSPICLKTALFVVISQKFHEQLVHQGKSNNAFALLANGLVEFQPNWSTKLELEEGSIKLVAHYRYSARRLIGSRIIESAAYCNQKLVAHLYNNSTLNTSVNWIIRLMLSLLCRPKVILLSGGHCSLIKGLKLKFLGGAHSIELMHHGP